MAGELVQKEVEGQEKKGDWDVRRGKGRRKRGRHSPL